jgi:hypothetical protein
MHLIDPGRARCNLDERLSVLMEKNSGAGDNDGGLFLVPAAVLVAGQMGAAKNEIVRAVGDAFLLESGL